jgi:hypothetical protein
MLTEALTIAAIVSSGLLTWISMKKYHLKIERRLGEIESHSTELKVVEKRFRK